MSDNMAAWLRTVVPTGWGALIAFLLSRLPAVHEILVNPAVTMFVTGLVVAAWYSLWKWLEPRLPHWLRTFVLGYDRRPIYHPGELTDAAWDNGYQAGQDEFAVPLSQQLREHPELVRRAFAPGDVPAEVLEEFKRSWEEHRQADVPRSIARPGESSGPHALTDIMPAVGGKDTESTEGTESREDQEMREQEGRTW